MQREIHNHHGRKYHARVTYIRAIAEILPGSLLKPGRRPRWLKSGVLCLYCGFTPNDFFMRVHDDLRRQAVRGE